MLINWQERKTMRILTYGGKMTAVVTRHQETVLHSVQATVQVGDHHRLPKKISTMIPQRASPFILAAQKTMNCSG